MRESSLAKYAALERCVAGLHHPKVAQLEMMRSVRHAEASVAAPQVRPEVVLIGAASGYQGRRLSGIPFTSERLLIAGSVPRVPLDDARLSLRPIPWREPRPRRYGARCVADGADLLGLPREWQQFAQVMRRVRQ